MAQFDLTIQHQCFWTLSCLLHGVTNTERWDLLPQPVIVQDSFSICCQMETLINIQLIAPSCHTRSDASHTRSWTDKRNETYTEDYNAKKTKTAGQCRPFSCVSLMIAVYLTSVSLTPQQWWCNMMSEVCPQGASFRILHHPLCAKICTYPT